MSSSVDQIACATPADFAAPREASGFGELALGRHVIPEERHAIGAVRAFEGTGEACLVAQVGGDDLRPRGSERPRLVAARVAGDGARHESARRIGLDGPHETAALAPVAPTTAMTLRSAMLLPFARGAMINEAPGLQ